MAILDVYGSEALSQAVRVQPIAQRAQASDLEALGAGFNYATDTMWIGRANSIRYNAIEEELAKFTTITGQPIDRMALADEFLKAHVGQTSPFFTHGRVSPYADAWELVGAGLAERVSQLPPDQQAQFNTDWEGRVRQTFEAAGQDYQRVMAAASGFGRFLGTAGVLGGGAIDPAMLAMSVVGGWAMIPRGLTIGRALLAEAGLGAALEAVVTPQVIEQQHLAGQDFGFFDAVVNILLAGVTSAAIPAAFKGAHVAGRAVNDRLAGLSGDARLLIDAIEAGLREAQTSPIAGGRGFEAVDTFDSLDGAVRSYAEGTLIRPMTADVDNVTFTAITKTMSAQARAIAKTIEDPELRAAFEGTFENAQTRIGEEIKKMDQELIDSVSPTGTTFKYAEANARVRDLEAQITQLDTAIDRLREGEPTAADLYQLAAYAPDPTTGARLEQISLELDTPGLTKKARTALEAERDSILPTVQAEIDDAALKALSKLRQQRQAATRKRRDLADQIRNNRLSVKEALRASLAQSDEYREARAVREQEVMKNVNRLTSEVQTGQLKAVEAGPPSASSTYHVMMEDSRAFLEQAIEPETVKVADEARATTYAPEPVERAEGSTEPLPPPSPDGSVHLSGEGETVEVRTLDDVRKEINEGRSFLKAFGECISG